ncbi:hypothetical protein CYMTET_13162 [Cymbomonas tetramitiformis]|uniref:Flavodoxin-like domain-containing protein n=1 Tax=Cymbomonas tetramitiformis TaxID=36881 RepID=A0AAE0GIP5_9CHLO|nr:hypothetical protein CYMTET_13162 [Cymbomonas tetramitiformis]
MQGAVHSLPLSIGYQCTLLQQRHVKKQSIVASKKTATKSRNQSFPLRNDTLSMKNSVLAGNRLRCNFVARACSSRRQIQTVDVASAPEVAVDLRFTQVADGVAAIRIIDHSTNNFEEQYSQRLGSTVNCYLVKGEQTALIDLPSEAVADAFVKSLSVATWTEGLQHIVLNDFGPKQAATLAAVLDAQPVTNPPVEIWCTNPTLQAITKLLKQEGSPLQKAWKRFGLRARLMLVKKGTSMDLGNERVLNFFPTSVPRWPSGMCTYDSESGALFTCNFFSSHVADAPESSGFDADVDMDVWRHYFNVNLSPVASQVSLPPVPERPSTAAHHIQNLSPTPADPEAMKMRQNSKVSEKLNLWAENAKRAILKMNKTLAMYPQPVKPTLETNSTDVRVLCPKHGPMVKEQVAELLAQYNAWIKAELTKLDESFVAVIYASAYGNTGIMAQAVAQGLRDGGVGVEMLNCEFSTASEVTEIIERSSGFVVGTPTLGGHMPTPVSEALGAILKEPSAKGQPFGVFGSYGWSGEGVQLADQRLRDGGFTAAFDRISVKFTPTSSDLDHCKASGEELAKEVQDLAKIRKIETKKKAVKSQVSAVVDPKTVAIGRITTAMSVLTTKDANSGVPSMMAASWVSQASFTPPGVTVALPKENSPEGLLLLNAKFTLNVLSKERTLGLTKPLLNKGFKTGNDIFEGMNVGESESSGCAILNDAASYLDCTVVDRMDCGDHWVMLCHIDSGDILDESAGTSFHYRTSGAEY